jgi:Mrp family chromosome partitioning ATPase
LATAQDQPEVYAAFVRVARRVVLTQRQTIGLVPATADVAIPPVALQLAVGLANLGARPVTILDANTRQPAFASLAAASSNQSAPFAVTFATDGVSVTSPRPMPGRGVARGPMEVAIDGQRAHNAHILVDMTGLDRLGELETSYELMDGVILVARGRETSERDLEDLHVRIPPQRRMGALIIG